MPRLPTPESTERAIDPDETETESEGEDEEEDQNEKEEEEIESQTASPSPPTPTPAPKPRPRKIQARPADEPRRSARTLSARLEALNKAKTPTAGVRKNKRGRPSAATTLVDSKKEVGKQATGKKRGRKAKASAEDESEAAEEVNSKVKKRKGSQATQDLVEYIVEKVVDSDMIGNKLHYLVKWKGYPHAQNTWEPAKNLVNASDEVEKLHKKFPNKPGPMKRGRK